MVRDLEALERKERRTFRVSVAFGLAMALLVIAVGWTIYVNHEQDSRLAATSACAERPDSIECSRGHANSVLLTTPEEACFILAQGGRECRRPLPDADDRADELRQAVSGRSVTGPGAESPAGLVRSFP